MFSSCFPWSFRAIILSTVILAAYQSHAVAFTEDWDGNIALVGGYRVDQIKCTVHAYDFSESSGSPALKDGFNAKDLHVYEIGGKGILRFCDSWIIKGYGLVGLINDGSFREDTEILDFLFHTKSKVHKGNTYDFSLALGYLVHFSGQEDLKCSLVDTICCESLDIGPTVGWAWNHQQFKIGKARTNDISNDIIDRLSIKNSWQGPWVGVDAYFDICNFDFTLSYEYHWARWHEKWTLDGSDVPAAFTDHRTLGRRYGSGNVIVFGASYDVCEQLFVGINLKWQYWRATGGKEKPTSGSFSSVGFGSNEHDTVPKATWTSFGVQVDLGYNF